MFGSTQRPFAARRRMFGSWPPWSWLRFVRQSQAYVQLTGVCFEASQLRGDAFFALAPERWACQFPDLV